RVTKDAENESQCRGPDRSRSEKAPIEEAPDARQHSGRVAPMSVLSGFPQRIVCLTEETTETLYLLGEDWRIVGISGFTVRPPQARKEKPRVSAFTSAKIDRIV